MRYMDRRDFLKVIGASGISVGLSGLIGCSQQLSLPKKKPNVLFIAIAAGPNSSGNKEFLDLKINDLNITIEEEKVYLDFSAYGKKITSAKELKLFTQYAKNVQIK